MINGANGSWQPVLTADQTAAAVAVAREVAARVREPARAEAAAAIARQQTGFPRSAHWQPFGIAQGYAGLALMCSYLDACFPGEGWDQTGHLDLELASRGAEQASYLPPGLFSGLSGLAFAAWQHSRDGARYRRLLQTLDQVLAPEALAMVENLRQQGNGVSMGDFDVISGLAGIGAYLLCRRSEPWSSKVLKAVVGSLVELTEEEKESPRWHTPGRLMWDEYLQDTYPHGNLNCGLAHGIPGPLALLALARLVGVDVTGLDDAIDRVAGWLTENRMDDQWGVNWPTVVALEQVDTDTGPQLRQVPASETPGGTSRTAWCYGSPGIARALWLAGEALNREHYREVAVMSMEAVYRRPISERRIDSPTFCHGVAGLLQITLRLANDTGHQIFTHAAQDLVEQLLSQYEPDSMLGYRDHEPGNRRIDQPGLLDGASGVAMVLLAAATAVEPTWDRLFLLS